jgi:cytochrome c-type biogenesis protein CcmE
VAQTTWEKVADSGPESPSAVQRGAGRWKFLVAGIAMLGAVVYLILSGTASGALPMISVNELVNDPKYTGQLVRVTGAVLGDTIRFDGENLIIEFTVASIPPDVEDLAQALYEATLDPDAAHMPVRVEGQPKPDLLQNEAQAIMTGTLGEDGVFRADEVLFKCPSRYGEADANQAISQPGTDY